MAESNTWYVFRPADLAWYMAVSACLSNVSASAPSQGDTATPMLALTVN